MPFRRVRCPRPKAARINGFSKKERWQRWRANDNNLPPAAQKAIISARCEARGRFTRSVPLSSPVQYEDGLKSPRTVGEMMPYGTYY